jgi:pimeloyl-ACP methyl ester carboxylesterase
MSRSLGASPTRVVMGGSRGGELALLLAATFPDEIRAVVAGVPSGFVWANVEDPLRAAWTLDGAPLPFVPSSGAFADVTTDDAGDQHWATRSMFLADIAAAAPAALEDATIHVERFSGPILFLAGEDDQLWPSCPMTDVAVERHAHDDDEVHCFPGAGHASFGVPGWSSVGSDEAFLGDLGAWLVLGGDAQANGRAIRDGDTALRGFLERAL